MIAPRARRWLAGLAAGLTLLTASVSSAPLGQTPRAAADTPPVLGACPALPADNVWNARVDSLPVHPRSSSYLSSIGMTTGLKADFGAGLWNGGPIGIPFILVQGPPKVPIHFAAYGDESDPGPYPIPPNAPVEGGAASTGDRHVLVVDQSDCTLYEMYRAFPRSDGSWNADQGSVFPLTSNALRPAGWTSADAAGLPILPGLARYDEVAAGQIAHALRFTASVTQRAYVWPARHYASSQTSTSLPPMGVRVRLKASFDISSYSAQNQVILRALKAYGMILADNGSNWYISGAPDERWNNNDLRALGQVKGSDFEVVDGSSLMTDLNSGQAGASSSSPTATRPPSTATATSTSVPSATATSTAPATSTPSANATATATSQAIGGKTLVVQGNSAMPDTWISPDYPATRFSALVQAHLQGSYTPDRLLFLPNLSNLPASAQVDSAVLSFYAYDGTPTNDVLAAHRVLTKWAPGSTTYRKPWAAAGMKPDRDYVATPVGTTAISGPGWKGVDVTAAVKSWLGGAARRGLMLRLASGAGNAHYRVDMADYSDPALRPRLVITYR